MKCKILFIPIKIIKCIYNSEDIIRSSLHIGTAEMQHPRFFLIYLLIYLHLLIIFTVLLLTILYSSLIIQTNLSCRSSEGKGVSSNAFTTVPYCYAHKHMHVIVRCELLETVLHCPLRSSTVVICKLHH